MAGAEHRETRARFDKEADLVQGFESPLGLELSSTVHWVISHEDIASLDDVVDRTYAWSPRKQQFTRRQLESGRMNSPMRLPLCGRLCRAAVVMAGWALRPRRFRRGASARHSHAERGSESSESMGCWASYRRPNRRMSLARSPLWGWSLTTPISRAAHRCPARSRHCRPGCASARRAAAPRPGSRPGRPRRSRRSPAVPPLSGHPAPHRGDA